MELDSFIDEAIASIEEESVPIVQPFVDEPACPMETIQTPSGLFLNSLSELLSQFIATQETTSKGKRCRDNSEDMPAGTPRKLPRLMCKKETEAVEGEIVPSLVRLK
jgi:hypothetical protein